MHERSSRWARPRSASTTCRPSGRARSAPPSRRRERRPASRRPGSSPCRARERCPRTPSAKLPRPSARKRPAPRCRARPGASGSRALRPSRAPAPTARPTSPGEDNSVRRGPRAHPHPSPRVRPRCSDSGRGYALLRSKMPAASSRRALRSTQNTVEMSFTRTRRCHPGVPSATNR